MWSVLIAETEFKNRINVVDVEVVANVVTGGTLTKVPDYDEIPRGNAVVDGLNKSDVLGVRKEAFTPKDAEFGFYSPVEFQGKVCKKVKDGVVYHFKQSSKSKLWLYLPGQLKMKSIDKTTLGDDPLGMYQDQTPNTDAHKVYSADGPGPEFDDSFAGLPKDTVRLTRQQFTMWIEDEDNKLVSS
jgi:hypothetical protein